MQWTKILNPPRPGKKLLVLDIDYTLFDHRSTAENPRELMRPRMYNTVLHCTEQFYLHAHALGDLSMRPCPVRMRISGGRMLPLVFCTLLYPLHFMHAELLGTKMDLCLSV